MDDLVDEEAFCGECDGEGVVTCWNCGGSGEDDLGDDMREECVECEGTGSTICDECDGGNNS